MKQEDLDSNLTAQSALMELYLKASHSAFSMNNNMGFAALATPTKAFPLKPQATKSEGHRCNSPNEREREDQE